MPKSRHRKADEICPSYTQLGSRVPVHQWSPQFWPDSWRKCSSVPSLAWVVSAPACTGFFEVKSIRTTKRCSFIRLHQFFEKLRYSFMLLQDRTFFASGLLSSGWSFLVSVKRHYERSKLQSQWEPRLLSSSQRKVVWSRRPSTGLGPTFQLWFCHWFPKWSPQVDFVPLPWTVNGDNMMHFIS